MSALDFKSDPESRNRHHEVETGPLHTQATSHTQASKPTLGLFLFPFILSINYQHRPLLGATTEKTMPVLH